MKGKFIVIEGLDGSGKGTQIAMLADCLKQKGISYTVTSEPTEHATGGLVRDTLCGLTKRTHAELAGLFLADRIAHCSNPVYGMKALLEKGINVICDRYYYSSFAYQGMDTDLEWCMKANMDCPDVLKPDVCVFLDVPPTVCDERISKGRAAREIYEDSTETITRIRNKYMEVFDMLKDTHQIKIINASRTPEEVSKDFIEAVLSVIE